MEYNFSKLQNGSDIRGVALDTVKDEKVNLDDETVKRITLGFLLHLQNKTEKKANELTISLGRDSRLSGPSIEKIMAKTLEEYGVKVMNAGLASTPAMFMSTIFEEFDCDGAVMITASHLPQNRNGMKFFSKKGGFEKQDIKSIIAFAESDEELSKLQKKANGTIEEIELMDRYADHLRALIMISTDDYMKPLQGMKITVDAGNGAGGFYATEVLKPLGADISSSQYLEPDGNFPGHIPNPENSEAIASICSKVKESGSDLGLIFDTDVDRASAVDENGKEINRNAIVALAAALITESDPGATIVTDSITSTQLHSFIEDELEMKHLRFKRGYRNVIGKAIELCNEGENAALAIETSGHAAYKENWFLDDGAYLATKIVIRAAMLFREGKGISSMLESLEEPKEAIEIRFPIKGDSGDRIIEDLLNLAKEGKIPNSEPELPNWEGVRIKFNDPEIMGWMLLRKSLHDPIMPLNIESDIEGGCKKIAEILKPILDNYEDLDIEKLDF